MAIKSGKYSCAFSVLKHQTYAWYNDLPLNYKINNMSQTQNLKPVFTETSGFYIFSRDEYLKYNSRITNNPYFS